MLNARKQECACGHTLHTASTYAKGRYLPHDRILLTLGATRRPVRVEVRCTRCDYLFGSSADRRFRERTCARDWVSREDLQLLTTPSAA
ncbi:MAG: hypothetical protein U1F27_14360 [Turneriella sp.]